MKQIIFLLFLVLSIRCSAHPSTSEIQKDPKYFISNCKKACADDFYVLALAYFYDQELDKAFEAFLDALKLKSASEKLVISQEEQEIFEQAHQFYMKEGAIDPIKTAQTLLDEYKPMISQEKKYLYLEFLLSTAYGNLGIYDKFFEEFYKNFSFFKESSLAYKTQGIICLRLSQHGKTVIERQDLRKRAEEFLQRSEEENSMDMGVYKALIYLSKEDNKLDQIKKYLGKVVESIAIIPRTDVINHVKEACAIQEYSLAQQIIDKAKSEYEYSRSLITAQEYLNSHKNKSSEYNLQCELK